MCPNYVTISETLVFYEQNVVSMTLSTANGDFDMVLHKVTDLHIHFTFYCDRQGLLYMCPNYVTISETCLSDGSPNSLARHNILSTP
jgi:hypothetical protein